jgi:hypothetical protein
VAEADAKSNGPLMGTLFWHWYDIGLGPGQYGGASGRSLPATVSL